MIKPNKDIAWIIMGQIIGLISNYMLLKILTNNLSVTSFGYYSLWMSILLFIRQVVYDPISIIAAKESTSDNFLGRRNLNSFQIIRYLTDKIFTLLIIVSILYIFIEYIFTKNIVIGLFFLLGIMYVGSNGAQGIYLNILNVLKKRKWASYGISADALMKVCVVTLTLLYFEKKQLIYVIFSIALSSLIIFTGLRYFIQKKYSSLKPNKKDNFIISRKLLILSLPLVIPTILVALKSVGDRWFMTAFIGIEELAAFTVLLQLGFIPMTLIIGIMQTYVSPNIYKLSDLDKFDGEKRLLLFLNSMLIKIIFFSGIIVYFYFLFSETLFEQIIGKDYLIYSKYLPYFVIAGSIAAISGILQVATIGMFGSKIVGRLMLLTVIISFSLFIILILAYGFIGGIVGLILSNLVTLSILLICINFSHIPSAL